jgi:acetone carboxylase gamma subunit
LKSTNNERKKQVASALIPRLENFDDGQPRIRDIDLAVALGYKVPAQIRRLIKDHREQLEEFGIITAAVINTGERGRPAEEHWLTERQALLLCTWAETDKADDVRKVLVEAFVQFRHGALVPVAETRETRVLTIQERDISAFIQPLLKPLESRLAVVEDTTQRIESKVDGNTVALSRVEDKLDVVVDHVNRHRKAISKHTRSIHIEHLDSCRNGICPCCHTIRIVERTYPTPELNFDHWFGKEQAGLTQTWPVCCGCNQLLRKSSFKSTRTGAFQEYQYSLDVHTHPLIAGWRNR